ncbi:MAG: carboxypeptidase-like regulatory domain-containing protein [Bacteroidales bacterium]|nr:carboxypeptidase-like regulatory domain-containing protein [Bacteroidales bacterium]MCF8343724.1 carboxypeptidase-like regulatory domain-containing protein [Bacteroidales bacterium]MCF8350448.1 carboxypeptidase-like regulatory domain-containing protein [Bacteroidales bacterium]MCF8376197.1 carboxypeptidase-like regulatory domain-containing protein [Bacteroidales bacterium]MCF8401137.1 carboxypeptidase-like regulatory domain-containing protein [Bacteroidales bacterium]
MKKNFIIALISVFLLPVAYNGYAEGNKESKEAVHSTTTIKGKITDANTTEELVCARIYIEEAGISTCSDVNGNYEIKSISPGKYNIKVEYLSYKVKSLPNVKITSGNEETLNIQLESL